MSLVAEEIGIGPNHVQDAFDSSFILLAMKRRRSSFVVKLPKREGKGSKEVVLQVDGAAVGEEEKKAADTTINLLPDGIRKRLNAAYKRVDDHLTRGNATVPHPTLDMLRVLPVAKQSEFFGGWPEVHRRFESDLDDFFAEYASEVLPHGRALIRKFFGGDDAARVEARHLPPLSHLRGKFGVKIVRGTFRYDDAADAAAAVRDLADGLRDRIEATLADVADRLRNGKVISEGTFTELRTVLATAKAFGEVMGDDVLDRADALEGRIDALWDAASVRGRTPIADVVRGHRALLDAAISDVMEAVKDPAGVDRVVSRFGAAPRLIEA